MFALSRVFGGRRSPFRGNLDVVNPLEASGWAEDRSRPGSRLTIEFLVDGVLVGEGLAARRRPDLEEHGVGDGCHAFLHAFARPLPVGPHEVVARIKGQDFVLAGSGARDIQYPDGKQVKGCIESLTPHLVSGWAVLFSSPGTSAEIEVRVADRLVARGKCGNYRPELHQTYGGLGYFGFAIPLGGQLTRKDFSRLRVAIADSGVSLALPANAAAAFPEHATAVARYEGHLDKAKRSEISGWMVDKDRYPSPATAQVFLNGIPVSTIQAGRPRPDLRQRFPEAAGRVGFSFAVQPTGATIQDAVLWMQSPDGSFALRNTPARFTWGPPGVRFRPERLIEFARRRLKEQALPIPPAPADAPRIGIIVLNRNGAPFLEDLFASFHAFNTWRNCEFLIIDHLSADGSRAVCEKWSEKLPIRFVPRRKNYSFSESNNYGAGLCDAPLLFFLNNDIQFCQDILGGMAAFFQDQTVGMAGLRLEYAPQQFSMATASLTGFGYVPQRVQHLGIHFASDYGDRPFLPFERCAAEGTLPPSDEPLQVPSVTAAAVMMRREDFFELGGFHEGYFYGYEDVDLALAVTASLGKKVVCAAHLRAFHLRSASLEQVEAAATMDGRRSRNRLVLNERTGGCLTAALRRERLADGAFLRAHPVRVALLVSEARPDTACGDYFTARELVEFMSRETGWDFYFVPREQWYDLQPFDIAIAMVEGFRIDKVETAGPHLLVVAWIRNWFDKWIADPHLEKYDQIWVSSEKAHRTFAAKTRTPVRLIRIATNPETFRRGTRREELASDYCFTGSYFGSARQIETHLDPAAIPFTGAIFGHNWERAGGFADCCRGPLPYDRMPDVYASTHIVLDDANHTTLEWGSANSRVFDALAAGKLVITNSQACSDDLFAGRLPVYSSPEELTELVCRYLENPQEREDLAESLREEILAAHTYAHRAAEACAAIREAFAARRACLFPAAEPQQGQGVLTDLVHTQLAAAGLFATVPGKTPLGAARAIGADLHVVFTGIDQAGTLPPRQGFQVRALVVLCPPLDLPPRTAAAFDLAIVPDEAAAEQMRRLADIPVLALAPVSGVTDAVTGTPRRVALQALFAEHLGGLIPALRQRLDALFEARERIPRSVAVENQEQDAPEGDNLAPEDLKLAYVLWDFPALSQTFVLNELRWLVENGYDVKVYYKTRPDREASLDFTVPAFLVASAEELQEYLRVHGRNRIHAHFAYPAAALLAYPAAVQEGVPFSFMAHAVDICHRDNVKRNNVAEVTRHPLCLKVVTLGLGHRNILLESGVPADKIVMERQASVLFPFRARTIRREGRRPLVIGIGRFIEKKGFDYLVQAGRLLPDVDFRIYGYGPLDAELRALADGLDNVSFPGVLRTADEVAAAYDAADLFAMPCVRAADGDMDGLPTVLLEAMSAGIPVVTTAVSNIGELVKDRFSGFIARDRDAEDLARAIRQALDCDPIRLKSIIETAQDTAHRFASIPKTMHTLTNIWRQNTVDIVLVTYNAGDPDGLAVTTEIINRIYAFTTFKFNCIVVDNHSDEAFVSGLQQAFADRDNFAFLPLSENIFCGPATNVGIAAGKSKYIIYLCSNEGFVLQHGWERELVRYMDEHPETALAGHLVSMPRYHDGKTYAQHPLFSAFRNQAFALANPDRPFSHVQGGAYILRRAAFERHGGFNEAVPHGGMDIEYSYYLESCGETLGRIPSLPCLTVKTRPTLTAVLDEFTVAAHPLTPLSAVRADNIVADRVRACNLCGWTGPAYDAGQAVCPACGSTPFSRSVMKLFGGSGILQHRPGLLLVSDDESLMPVAAPLCATASRLPAATLREAGAVAALLDDPAATLVVVDHLPWTGPGLAALANAARRFASRGGILVCGENLLAGQGVADGEDGSLAPVLGAAGLAVERLPFRSAVLELDWRGVFLAAAPGRTV